MNLHSVYIGMALTHATHTFRERFGIELPRLVAQKGFAVTPFLGLTHGTALDVYHHDIHAVRTADYMLAVCDTPSLGLGMEIMERIHTGKPLLVAWRRGEVVTRMLTGAVVEHKVSYIPYGDMDDIVRALNDVRTRFPCTATPLAQA